MWSPGPRLVVGLKERVVLPLAKRWIAGVTLDSVIKDAKRANARGIGVVANFLGEEIKDPSTADAHAAEYLKLQQALADEKISGFASVKLTQLGLGADEEGMQRRLEKMVKNSERLGQVLWIDMESSAFTEFTIKEYISVHQLHRGLGVAIQAYTRRSGGDLDAVLDAGGRVRLVKGAYRESPDFVFPSRREVRENYSMLLMRLFERGEGFAVGTHDYVLIEEAKKLADSSHADFHFEMLKGIRDELKDELVKSGYKVSEYIPYGDSWYAYSKRRITEHPSNIWLLLRSLV